MDYTNAAYLNRWLREPQPPTSANVIYSFLGLINEFALNPNERFERSLLNYE
jgi:hypothetical protein